MKPNPPIAPGFSPSPIWIALRPGQTLTIVATDDSGNVPEGAAIPSGAFQFVGGRSTDSPRKSPDSPRKSPDSPRKSPDASRL